MSDHDLEIEVYEAKHHPIVAEYARRIGLVDAIDRHITGDMEVNAGVVVLAMVLDALSGRSPLFRLSETYRDKDREVLLGEDVPCEKLKDHVLGRVLDRIYEHGTNKLFTEIAVAGLAYADIAETAGHFDTTSMRVWGDFDPERDDPFVMQYGYSKDKRPDLKQFVFTLLTVKGGLPVRYSVEDGAASDRALNGDALTMIAERFAAGGLPKLTAYVADSAMVNEENLKLLGATPFVTRLPATYNECARVIHDAVHADDWEEIGVLAQSGANSKRPPARYKAAEGSVELYGETYRAVVVHSSVHDRRRTARLQRTVAADRKASTARADAVAKQTFQCRPDAAAAAAAVKNGTYHRCTASVVERPVYGRGRPPKHGPRRPAAIRYGVVVRIEPIAERIRAAEQEAGCFVLIAGNLDREQLDARGVLSTYKEQHAVEKGFEFLKDPMILDSLFLKNAGRIEALGFVMVVALFIWRLMQYIMRKRLREHDRDITGWVKRRTRKPTAFMMCTKFVAVQVIKVNGVRRLARKLDEAQRAYLWALGVNESIYKRPPETSGLGVK